MIVLSDQEYKTLMGDNWRMGMLSETMKVFGPNQDVIFIDKKKSLEIITAYAEKRNWNTDYVIGIYMTADPQEGTMADDDIRMLHALRTNDIVPCYVFETQDIASVERLIEVVTRVGNLRAFL